jgi:hypothetical protein
MALAAEPERGWEQTMDAANGRVTPRDAACARFGSWRRILSDVIRDISHWGLPTSDVVYANFTSVNVAILHTVRTPASTSTT